jgi:UPF0755 protein
VQVKRKLVVPISIILVVLGLLAFAFRSELRSGFEGLIGNDFPGPGAVEVSLTIEPGDDGEAIARDLVAVGVVKNFNFTYKLMISRNQTFIPGTFRMLKSMKAADALDRLQDTSYLSLDRVTIREGLRIGQVFRALSEGTGVSIAELEAVTLKDLGLPTTLPSVEGYLFPATYDFAPGTSAKVILKMMVERMNEELQYYSVASKDRHKVLTLASIIQKEAAIAEDFFKVSRVFTNRLDIGMHLQSDATVSYGSGGTTVTTTDAERSDPNGYNTYRYPGLPIGPISAPGSQAIDAALNPTDGSWLYFCAVNLKTGETVFSTTYAEHQVAVAQWQAWMRANPGWNG